MNRLLPKKFRISNNILITTFFASITFVISFFLEFLILGELYWGGMIASVVVSLLIIPIILNSRLTNNLLAIESLRNEYRLRQYADDIKISRDDFSYLSTLTPILTTFIATFPYLVWLYLARNYDLPADDFRYYVYTFMIIAIYLSSFHSYYKRKLTGWISILVICYTMIPFISIFQSLSLANAGLLIISASLLTMIASWKMVFYYTTIVFVSLLSFYWYLNENFVFVKEIVLIDGQDLRKSYLDLSEFSAIVLAYFNSLSISWITYYLVRSSATKRQETIVAYNHLEEKKTQQDYMFSIIGHELRTPIAAISMMMDEIIEEAKDKDCSDELKELLSSSKTELIHTLAVLDDMRIVATKDTVKEYSITTDYPAQILKRVANTLSKEAQQVGLDIEVNYNDVAGNKFMIASRALTQISLNMVKNAIRHSSASKLKISLYGQEISNSKVHLNITFTDNGVGIPKHLHDKIFDAFYSRDISNNSNTGLGLFIVSELVDVMDGELSINSEVGKGTSFSINLILDEPVYEDIFIQSDLKVKSKSVSWKGKEVLFVEDNPSISLMTTKILEKMGAKVTSCMNGLIALEAYSQSKYDIIITDYFMPEMNGEQLISEIRKYNKYIPIIAVTAATAGEEFDRLKDVGASKVISKPATSVSLTDALNEVENGK